jgi:hypothetical protein
VDSYPYPFIDVNDLGYRGVAITSVVFAVAFWLLGLLFVAGDRLPGRRDPAPDPPGAEELQQVARRRGSVRSRGSG